MTIAASNLGPVTSAAHHVVQSTYMFFCTCGDAVSQAAQSFLPGKVRNSIQVCGGHTAIDSSVVLRKAGTPQNHEWIHAMLCVYMMQKQSRHEAMVGFKRDMFAAQVGKPEAAQSLGKQLMTTGFSIGIFNSVLAGTYLCFPFLWLQLH